MAGSTDHLDAAVEPASTGVASHGGVHLAWKAYGAGETTVLLLPTWQIIDSRFWKAQVGYLSRHCRVITYDGRGSGDSDRPTGAAAYSNDECAADALAVLDATGTARAVLVALSCGVAWAVHVAADHPERVRGIFALSPSCGVRVSQPEREAHAFDERLSSTRGWAKYNRYYWTEGDFADFRDFFFREMFTEPHSTKQVEDALRWSAQLAPQMLVDATLGRLGRGGARCRSIEDACQRVRCPVLVVHGTADRVRSATVGARVAELTGGRLLLIEGGGHGLMSRIPVKINLLIHHFVTTLPSQAPRLPRHGAAPEASSATPPSGDPRGASSSAPHTEPGAHPRGWSVACSRPRRVLYLSSPIGLGHAARDLAIVRQLRHLC